MDASAGASGPVFSSSRILQWSSLSESEREQFTRFVVENQLSVRVRGVVMRAGGWAATGMGRVWARG